MRYRVFLRRSRCLKYPSSRGQILQGSILSLEEQPSVRVHNRKHMELRLYWHSLKVSAAFFPYHTLKWLWGFVRQSRTGSVCCEICNATMKHFTSASLSRSLATCLPVELERTPWINTALKGIDESSCVYLARASIIKCLWLCRCLSVISRGQAQTIQTSHALRLCRK